MKFDKLDKRVDDLENITDPGGWEEVRLTILLILDDYPDAKEAVASRLAEDRREREWPELRSFILDSLQAFPAARERMIAALEEVET